MIDEIVNSVVVIYTKFNPHPTRERKADCDIEKNYKKGLRVLMKKELQDVIDKYEKKMKEL